MMMGMIEKEESEINAIGQLAWGATTVQAQIGSDPLTAIVSRAQATRGEAGVQLLNICLIVLLLPRRLC
jgi:hypothetical protein